MIIVINSSELAVELFCHITIYSKQDLFYISLFFPDNLLQNAVQN